MTFEQVVLLLSLIGGAIYVTFQITWTFSTGKNKRPPQTSNPERSFFLIISAEGS